MKYLKINFLLIVVLSCVSLTVFGQNDALKTVSKSDYNAVKNELLQTQEINQKLEKAYGEAITLLEEMIPKNKALNELIDRDIAEFTKYKERFAQLTKELVETKKKLSDCTSKKRN